MIEQSIILATILVFLILGLLRNKSRNNSISEFALVRRKLSWFPIAGGISMTYIGGAAILNTSALAYSYGFYPMVDAVAFLGAIIIILIFIKPIWHDKGVTVSDLISGGSDKLSILIGIISALVFTLILAAQFVAIGKLIGPYFPEIDENLLVVIPSIAIYFYVFKGGFRSVTRTDVLQLMFITIFIILPIIWFNLSTKAQGEVSHAHFEKMPLNLILLLSVSLLYLPLSHDINIRVKSAATLKQARIGLVIGAVIYTILLFSTTSIGIQLAKDGVVLSDGEQVFSTYFKTHFETIGIFAILGALAAIISSMDSFALNAITTLSNDVLKKNSLRDRSKILIASVSVLITALIIAIYFNQILAIIMAGIILYVTIIGSIALGRYLKVKDNLIFLSSLLTIAILLTIEITTIQVTVKMLVYPIIGVIPIFILKAYQKVSSR